jgi:hypothetical protein
MDKAQRDTLISRSISVSAVRVADKYTVPPTYRVYKLRPGLGRGREFRYGNHPIRQHELVRDYGSAHLEALFESRYYAKAFARFLNRG